MSHPDYGSESFDSTTINELRSGTITDRRLTTSGPEVMVLYPDRGVTSDWIPVGQQGAKGTVFHYCPRVGDNVIVAHFPTGIETGVIIASNPTPNNPGIKPRSLNSVAMQGDDKAYFEYDPDAGCLSINGISTVYLKAGGEMEIISGTNIKVNTTGDLTATVGGNLTANVTGTTTLTAANTVFNGPVQFNNAVTMETTLQVLGSTTVQDINILGTETGGGPA